MPVDVLSLWELAQHTRIAESPICFVQGRAPCLLKFLACPRPAGEAFARDNMRVYGESVSYAFACIVNAGVDCVRARTVGNLVIRKQVSLDPPEPMNTPVWRLLD